MGTPGPSYYLHWDPLAQAPPPDLLQLVNYVAIHWQAVDLRLQGFLVVQAISPTENDLDHLYTICHIWTTTFLPRYLILKEVTVQPSWLRGTLLEPRITLHCGISLSESESRTFVASCNVWNTTFHMIEESSCFPIHYKLFNWKGKCVHYDNLM